MNKTEAIVILSPGFPKDESDTACITPQQIFVKALKDISPELTIIVLAFQYPYHTVKYAWNGIEIIPLGGENKGKTFRLITWCKAYNILKQLSKQYQIIGLLSFWFGECALVGHYFAKRNNLIHYSWLLGQDAKPGNKYFKWIRPRGGRLVALSDFVAAEVKKNYGVTVDNIVPVGIDTAMFKSRGVKRDIDLLGVGSLIPLKQYELFVNGVFYLKNTFPGINAVICGQGPEINNLKALSRSLNLCGNLSFIGEVPHYEVLDLMQRSKILLHPSRYEGFGAVLAEALYAGAQVVSFTKPMQKTFENHHVVNGCEAMHIKLSAILQDEPCACEPVLMYPAWLTAKMMISLFVD